jgi:hypothetical protein
MRSLPAMVIMLAFALFALVSQVLGGEMKAYRIREDYGAEPLSECMLQYYYFIPCPTEAWFWAFSFGMPGDRLGVFFEIGDISMETGTICDPEQCHTLDRIRILDFAGYGTMYPGWFTVEFDVYCSDERGCRVGEPIWNSGSVETVFGWNYVEVEPPLCLTGCCSEPLSSPRILVLGTQTGTMGCYPAWGMDNISTPIEYGCEMHDISCLPALYPRPSNSHYSRLHTGYYGFEGSWYCPPWPFADGRDTTRDLSQFGGIEAAWRIYLSCTGPTGSDPTTWSAIKRMYK